MKNSKKSDGKINVDQATAYATVEDLLQAITGQGPDDDSGTAADAGAGAAKKGGSIPSGKDDGGETSEEGGVTSTTVSTGPLPPDWDQMKALPPITFMIVHGFHPSKRYRRGQVVKNVLDLWVRGKLYTVHGVKMVYLTRKKVPDDQGGKQVMFRFYFPSDWYIPEIKLGVLGGKKRKIWYGFPNE